MHFYRISGLCVACEIALPGLIGADVQAVPDVVIRAGRVPDALDGVTKSGPTWQAAERQFLLHIPGVARFLFDDGRVVTYAPESAEALADLPIFLVGTVIGILLHQREQIVLHASAVCVHGKAVLFCGASGAGKSTLAAALAQRGYPLVTDDVCSISIEAGALPRVHSDGRQLKLWAQAIDSLGLDSARGARVRTRLEKYYVAPGDTFSEPLPVAAVYVLREARPPHAPRIQRANAIDAALQLRRNAYRPLLVNELDQRANYFRASAEIAGAVGVYLLTRALDFAKMPDVIEGLEQHWHDLGAKAA